MLSTAKRETEPFLNSLPPACFIFAPEFHEEPELIFVSDSESACSVVVDQPTNFGDEFDDSSDDETETDMCQCGIWILDGCMNRPLK